MDEQHPSWTELGTEAPTRDATITVAIGGLIAGLHFFRVLQLDESGWAGSSRGFSFVRFRASEEGTMWIRGYHSGGSEQGAALLAAQALVG